MARTREIEGVKDTVKALRRIDPELRKEFNIKVKAIAAPMTDAMKSEYSNNRFPSGTKRKWTVGKTGDYKGRSVFPLTAAKAQAGVKVKINTSYRDRNAFYVMQANPAAAIFDMAGKKNMNLLGTAFSSKFGGNASRVMWPVAEQKLNDVQKGIEDLVEDTEKVIQKEVNR
jgi:hypothetical protein